MAECLVAGMFSWIGVPQELHSDQGMNFERQFFAKVSRLLGVKKTRANPLHPQSDELVELFTVTEC